MESCDSFSLNPAKLNVYKSILFREVHHKVKDKFHQLAELFECQMGAEYSKGVLSEQLSLANRVRDVGEVYGRLADCCESDYVNFTDFIWSHVSYLHENYKSSRRAVSFDIQAMRGSGRIDFGHSEMYGLIINELVANAFRHAFPIGLKEFGSISIKVIYLSKAGIELSVEDNGIGIAEKDAVSMHSGFGLPFVARIVDQVGGEFSIRRDMGTKCLVKC